jgi:Cys-tRNA synthase (O-phospho-L-seryl-tRNA:Cys-tRNA synthase)
MRKTFNFYRSYWDVANELNDKDRLAFYDALMKRQFTGVEPNLEGMVKFAYLSQKHSIDRQIEGFENKTKTPLQDPTEGGMQGGVEAPTVQLKEKEKEKEKEEYTKVPFQERVNKFLNWFNAEFVKHGKQQAKFRTLNAQTESNLKKLLDKYNTEEWCLAFENMICNTWVIENKNATPDHFLRPANFEKYLNQVKNENTKTANNTFAWDR